MRLSTYFVTSFLTLVLVMSQAPIVSAETESERKARLELELQLVEREILQQQVLVEDKQIERQSLERDLNLLDAQIRKAKLGIQARAVAIEQLGDQIGDKRAVVDELTRRLDRQRQSLGQLIRKTQEVDNYTLVEIMLGKNNFSRFFEDFESYQSIKSSLNQSLAILKDIKNDTEEQVDSLEKKHLSELEMKRVQELQKQEVEQKEKEKAQILTITKGEERAYVQLLESKQRTAAELRRALFTLLGGGGGIPFPEAVDLAKYAEQQTGVAASFILAILEQETQIGKNLGSCIYNDMILGKTVMHPDRDAPIFLAISEILTFDPRSRQVSCPRVSGGERYGWGGAMGPSQFIPSTWAMYGGIVNEGSGWVYVKEKDRIRNINGGTGAANPFSNRDAFLATALLLRDNGANATYNGDRLAALRYYAGWGGASRPENQFYGDQVMQRKARLETEIKTLSGS